MKLDLQISVKGAPEGCAAYAYTGGKPFDASLPCAIFIHGALHDHSVWTLLARWCAHHGYGVLAVDLPGHGRSLGAPLASIEELADWTLALQETIGVAKSSLIGHSMGSLIALEAAARAPDRAARLVMFGTAFPMKVSEALLSTALHTPLKAVDMVNVFSHSGMAAKPSYPGPGSWLRGANRALMRRVLAGQPSMNLFHHDFSVCDSYAGGFEAAKKVTCPTTLILGEADQMTAPKQSREIAKALRASVHMVRAGHAMMSEAPDEVLVALRAALT